ncbi:hypothetical protein [Streptomyces sp. sk2.1]|uniref:hypothetical protein n=1 Tax=Streptomyces sp. sk2.1 TaxID=2478959 RepID=UPI0011E74C45|nr:hypothetical protein [Streptomyces sp. sk2.1]TXS64233.1 hypothetical protein EAO76_39580 [Streptomyces sp. sk2.1]
MTRGRYGTLMTIRRLPAQPPGLRRKGTCPKCYAMQGEQCRDRPGTPPPNGVHGERLRANDVAPAALPPYRGRRRGRHTPR